MKKLLLFILVSITGFCYSQNHEKVLEIMNYARTNPKEFSEKVAAPYIEENGLNTSRYSKSLLRTLGKLKPMPALKMSDDLDIIAQKYAEKAGKFGWTDHRSYNARFKAVEDLYGLTAENLDFGSTDELEIVMDLLIDEDIPSLGHRENILDPELTHVGFGFAKHKTWDWIYVMNFGAELL